MAESGTNLATFVCPSRGEDFIRGVGTNAIYGGTGTDVNRMQESKFQMIRTSFYIMAGRDDRAIRAYPRHGYSRVWVPPMAQEDPAELPMVACVLEQRTLRPYEHSSYPHGSKGFIEASPSSTPEDTASEGGNVASNDGSTRFVRTNEAVGWGVASGGPQRVGYWNDVDAYDAANHP